MRVGTGVAAGGLVLLIVGTASVVRGTEAGPEVGALIARLQAVAVRHVEAETVPGIVLAVAENGAAVHAEGFGRADLKSGRPMTASTPINIGSISKAVATWGFLRFCRSEGIDLDAPLLPRIQDFTLRGTKKFDGSGVTVRRVLGHTAGLSMPSVPVFPASNPLPALEQVLAGRTGGVSRLTLERQPGRGFLYSGGGFLLLQLMLEQTTDGGFASFMAREVLRPAGLGVSSFRLTPEIRSQAASYYRSDGRRRALYHLPGAAGALYSTAEEMGRWLTLYAESSGAYEELLAEADFRSMLEPQAEMYMGGLEAAGSAYALGHATWTSRTGRFYVFHAGGNPGLRAFFFVVPETGNGMFLAANHDEGQRAFRDLLDAWAEHYGEAPPPLF